MKKYRLQLKHYGPGDYFKEGWHFRIYCVGAMGRRYLVSLGFHEKRWYRAILNLHHIGEI